MATSVAAPSGPIAFPSRLVPGLPISRLAFPPALAPETVNEPPCALVPSVKEVQSKLGRWSRVAQTLLPTPGTENQRPALFSQVAADFISWSVALALGSLLLGRMPTRIAPTPGAGVAPICGLILLAGTMFTLLGYSE